MSRRLGHALALSLFILPCVSVQAQPGAWIEYACAPFGSGSRLYRCGDTCLGFTYENSARLVFFDTDSDVWSERDFDFEQHWETLAAAGDLVLAVSDSFVVAYNARTALSHTLRYEGEILLTTPAGQSLGCGRALAYLLTDTRLYVFDAELDLWREYDYGLPADYNGFSHAWVRDTYMAVALNREYPARRKNVVYSLPVHAFNQTDDGAGLGEEDELLDHGFASTVGTESPDIDLVGYSALSNQFSVVEVPFEHDIFATGRSSVDLKDLRTTYTASCVEVVPPGDIRVHHMWGYDTILGCWTYRSQSYDPDDLSPVLTWRTGGRFAVSHARYLDDDHYEFTVYSGHDGQFVVRTPGVHESGTTAGGNVFLGAATGDVVWGYCPESGLGSVLGLDRITTSYRAEGEDFISFGRRESGSDRMTLYFYHGPSNSWTTSEIWKELDTGFTCGTHVYATREAETDVEMVFYSPILNTVQTQHFPLGGSWSTAYSDYFACFWNTLGEGAFFDATTGVVQLVDFELSHDGTGDLVCLGVDEDARTIHGYSRPTGNWTALTIAETPRIRYAIGHLGLATVQYTSNKYWAFNGFYDAWVELVPSGAYAGFRQGERVILVVRSNMLYAFDPDATLTGVEDGDDPVEDSEAFVPRAHALRPCYPNPLNPETVVSFDLPVGEWIDVAVYDLRGHRVRILAEGHWPAGSHALRWDGRDDAGRLAASGTYVLRLETESFVGTQKAALVK